RSVLPEFGLFQKKLLPAVVPPTPELEIQREDDTPTPAGLVLPQAGMMTAASSAARRAPQILPLVISRPSKVFGFYYIQDGSIKIIPAAITATPRRIRPASSGGRPRRRTGLPRPGRAPAWSGRPARGCRP